MPNKPHWLRRLTRILTGLDIVKHTRLYKDRLVVQYQTGYRRTYVFQNATTKRWARQISWANSKVRWPLDIKFQFTWDPLDPHQRKELEPYFYVSRSTIDGMSRMEHELLVQELLGRILRTGFIRPHIDEQTADKDLEYLKTTQTVFCRGTFDMFAPRRPRRKKPGLALVEKYCPIEDTYRRAKQPERTLRNALTNTRILFANLFWIIDHTTWDLTIDTLYKALYSKKYGPTWQSPATWRAIIKQLFGDLDAPLTDLSPNVYEKAIAAALLGRAYAPIEGAVPEPLCRKLKLQKFTPSEPHKLAIFDNQLQPPDLDELHKHIRASENLIAFVPRQMARSIKDCTRPSRAVRVTAKGIPNTKPDYLFIYSAKI